MATRTQVREAVIGLLYAYDSGNQDVDKNAMLVLEEKKIRNKQKDFAISLFKGTLSHIEEINITIQKHLKEWDFKRLGGMEKSILQLGAYEILYTQTDSPIVINEAIELAKNYGEENAPKLVNGILDSITKQKVILATQKD